MAVIAADRPTPSHSLLDAMREQGEQDLRRIADSPVPAIVEDDTTARIEDGYWTTACLDCGGTGWFDGTHPGEEPWGFPDTACKGTGRTIICLARPDNEAPRTLVQSH